MDLTTNQSTKRFILLGGFLGAGKTTLIGVMSKWLSQNHFRAAIITNDQAGSLLDTATSLSTLKGESLGSNLSGVEEVTGGCFCCKLGELQAAIGRLEIAEAPDVIIAEPVGSCTDLMATVILPLKSIYGISYTLSPLSVLVDSRRAYTALGGKRSVKDFHRQVSYVFEKQLEEAEWIVINKTDLLNAGELDFLRCKLKEKFPTKRLHFISTREASGLEEYFSDLMSFSASPDNLMEVDYECYAEGEAMLGWLNLTAACQPKKNERNELQKWLQSLCENISQHLEDDGAVIAHLKMSIEFEGNRWRANKVMNEDEVVVYREACHPSAFQSYPKLIINLRAQGLGERFKEAVESLLQTDETFDIEIDYLEAFQPAKPMPTQRVTAIS